MNKKFNSITLYGSGSCHKSQFYQNYLSTMGLNFVFKDVTKDKEAAQELRNLYKSGKLNFPTIVIDGKKLRNPSINDLEKQLIREL